MTLHDRPCHNCKAPAFVRVHWMTRRGSQCAELCEACGAIWWQTYKNTPSGQSAIFERPEAA